MNAWRGRVARRAGRSGRRTRPATAEEGGDAPAIPLDVFFTKSFSQTLLSASAPRGLEHRPDPGERRSPNGGHDRRRALLQRGGAAAGGTLPALRGGGARRPDPVRGRWEPRQNAGYAARAG